MTEELTEILENATQSAVFTHLLNGTDIRANRLRYLYQHDLSAFYDQKMFLKFQCPEPEIKALSNQIFDFMAEYICPVEGRIGVQNICDIAEPTIPDFAEMLVRASCALGSERVVRDLCEWKAGKPIRYWRKMWLVGARVEENIFLESGIGIKQIPSCGSKLSAHVPHGISARYSATDLLAGVVLAIEHEISPGLYRPPVSQQIIDDIRQADNYFRDPVKGLSRASFCEALSLACNHDIRIPCTWNDFGEFQQYRMGGPHGVFWDVPLRADKKLLTRDHLKEAVDNPVPSLYFR